MGLFSILLLIAALFFLLLIGKSIFFKKKEFCAICFAVGGTWVGLLIAYWYNIFNDKVILGILIGQSSLGIFYTLEKNVKKELTLFRLPFLLLLIFIAYLLIVFPELTGLRELYKSGLFLLLLWAGFILVYFYRNNKNIRVLQKMVIFGIWR